MYEWLFLRLLMLGAMVGGGVVLALAGTALDKWRARRAAVNCTRESDANTAKHCGNLTEFDRLREQLRHPLSARKGSDSGAQCNAELTDITTRGFPRMSLQTRCANGRL